MRNLFRTIIEKLRRDSLWMGLFIGIIVPAILYGVIYGLIALGLTCTGKPVDVLNLVSSQKIILLSIVPNVFILRYYLLKLKFDLTGKGILMVTFIIGILFAILEFVA